MKIKLGYTLTDCYSANANFNGQQKQYVVEINEELFNVFLKGYVNGPADTGRERIFYKIADLMPDDLKTLQEISKYHKDIKWNKGCYTLYPEKGLLTRKKEKELKSFETEYIKAMMRICEPVNVKNLAKVKRGIKSVLKKYLSKENYKDCDRFIYLF